LSDEQLDVLVAYLRSWEANPPVDLPPEVPDVPSATASGSEIYVQLCAQCHGPDGEGGIGPSLSDPVWQASQTDRQIIETIDLGHPATAMIAWGEILSTQQIAELVKHIRTLTGEGPPPSSGSSTFEADVLPIFQAKCAGCHGTLGGWTGTSYEEALNTGEGGPTIIPGDPDNSVLVQTLTGTHPEGIVMPPGGTLPQGDIQTIIDWIAAGAPER